MKIGSNITSDQNTIDVNNIKTQKAEDAAHGALEDERFTLIPFMKADFPQRDFSPGSMKLIKKGCYFPLVSSIPFTPMYPDDR